MTWLCAVQPPSLRDTDGSANSLETCGLFFSPVSVIQGNKENNLEALRIYPEIQPAATFDARKCFI